MLFLSMKALVPALLIALGGLSLHAADVIAEPFPPARFTSLYIEKDDKGVATVIQMAGDAVSYKVIQGDKVLESTLAHPSGDDWFAFIQGLNTAKVYKWAPRYELPGQGAAWVIDLAMKDRKFTSEGTNEYPKNGAESEPTADANAGPSIPFQLFWQAALGLVGKAAPIGSAK
jgi:hypothetical protein